MKSQFVADGEDRWYASGDFQSKLGALRASVHARYAAEFGEAGIFRRLVLRCRMAIEYRRERRKILPSSESLYICCGANRD